MNDDTVFKALADPTRRLMIKELSQRANQTLFELCARLTMKHKVNMSRQAITKHLDILEKAGLVKSEFRGKYRVLNFNNDPITHVMEDLVR